MIHRSCPKCTSYEVHSITTAYDFMYNFIIAKIARGRHPRAVRRGQAKAPTCLGQGTPPSRGSPRTSESADVPGAGGATLMWLAGHLIHVAEDKGDIIVSQIAWTPRFAIVVL